MDEVGNALGIVFFVGMLAIMVLFGFFGPGFGIEELDVWPDTSGGAVVTVQSAEHTTHVTPDGRPIEITHGGNTLVVILSSFWAAVGELFATLCGGGIVMWAALIVLTILGLAGIGAAR